MLQVFVRQQNGNTQSTKQLIGNHKTTQKEKQSGELKHRRNRKSFYAAHLRAKNSASAVACSYLERGIDHECQLRAHAPPAGGERTILCERFARSAVSVNCACVFALLKIKTRAIGEGAALYEDNSREVAPS